MYRLVKILTIQLLILSQMAFAETCPELLFKILKADRNIDEADINQVNYHLEQFNQLFFWYTSRGSQELEIFYYDYLGQVRPYYQGGIRPELHLALPIVGEYLEEEYYRGLTAINLHELTHAYFEQNLALEIPELEQYFNARSRSLMAVANITEASEQDDRFVSSRLEFYLRQEAEINSERVFNGQRFSDVKVPIERTLRAYDEFFADFMAILYVEEHDAIVSASRLLNYDYIHARSFLGQVDLGQLTPTENAYFYFEGLRSHLGQHLEFNRMNNNTKICISQNVFSELAGSLRHRLIFRLYLDNIQQLNQELILKLSESIRACY